MAEDTRTNLLEAAGQVFAERGYEAATVRDICQRAGANLAAVNYHFGDKRRLYIEAVRHAFCLRAEQYPLEEPGADVTPQERLRTFVLMFLIRLLREERPVWHKELVLHELARPTEACGEVVRDYIRPMADVLESIGTQLMPGLPREQVYLIGFSVVGQCLFYYVHQPIAAQIFGPADYAQLSLEQLADHIARFTLAALGHAPPVGQASFGRATQFAELPK